jgi:O-antigen/teichoic acid export membrane protein
VLLVAGGTLAIGLLTLVAGATNIALNIALVPLLGIEGSALAALASYALLHALLARAASRDDRLPRPRTTLIIKLAVGAAIALAATRLPTTAPFLAARLVIALGCLTAMGAVVLRIVAPRGGSLAGRVAALLDPLARTA